MLNPFKLAVLVALTLNCVKSNAIEVMQFTLENKAKAIAAQFKSAHIRQSVNITRFQADLAYATAKQCINHFTNKELEEFMPETKKADFKERYLGVQRKVQALQPQNLNLVCNEISKVGFGLYCQPSSIKVSDQFKQSRIPLILKCGVSFSDNRANLYKITKSDIQGPVKAKNAALPYDPDKQEDLLIEMNLQEPEKSSELSIGVLGLTGEIKFDISINPSTPENSQNPTNSEGLEDLSAPITLENSFQ